MFSRYKKSATPVKAAAPAAAAPAPEAPKPAPAAVRRKKPVAAQAGPVDKEKKRKERLSGIKLELHRALLENLNLSALDQATENALRDEISAIAT